MRKRPLAAPALRVRLIIAAGGSILAAVGLLAVATVVLVRRELLTSLDQALRDRAQVVAQLAVSAPAVLTQPGALETPVSGRQIAVEVLDARGRILARSLTLGARLLPQDRLVRRALSSGSAGFEDVRLADRLLRIYAAPVAQAGGPASGGAVVVASDTTDIAQTIDDLALLVAVSGLGVGLVAVAAAAAMTRRGLAPLRRLVIAAGEIERTADPSLRLPERHVTDEIGELTGVLNRMLASLQQARDSERRFLLDASHELRTPVTTLLGNVEYATRHGVSAEVLAELQRDAARLARLVDDLLTLERAGVPAHETAPMALDELVAEVVGRYDGPVRLGVVERLTVRGERDALARALSNVVENGMVHGPAGGRVTVSLQRRGDHAALTVSDEGPGPDPSHRDRLFERFWRAPEASERPGSGLGLSIVAAIMERHHGRVLVEGSAFTIELPVLCAHTAP